MKIKKTTTKKHLLWLLPIAAYLALTILAFYPILKNINGSIFGNIPGSNAQDAFQNIWNFWWAKKSCLGFCGDFWQTNYQFFPQGSSLIFHTFSFPNILIMLPFIHLGGSYVASYNLSLFLSVFLSMLAMFLLVKHLTKNPLAAFISGLTYGYSPFLFGHILDGQLNLSSIYFFPLLLLLLVKNKESDNKWLATGLGVLLFLIGINDFVFLIFGFIIWLLWFIYRYLTEHDNKKNILLKAIIPFIIFFALFLPFSLKNFKEINNFDLNGKTNWNSNFSSIDLRSLFTPPPYTLIGTNDAYSSINGIYSDKTVYIGITTLILSLVGIFSFRAKQRFFWLSLGITGLIFSLGPNLHLNGIERTLRMPFEILEKIPILNVIRAPSRFNIIFLLSLIVFSGYGLSYIFEKAKKYRVLIFSVVLLLIIVELFPFNATVRHIEVPDAYSAFKNEKLNSTILEVPTLWMNGLENKTIFTPEHLYFQTYHEKAMSSGYVTRTRKADFSSYGNDPLLRVVVINKKISQLPEETQTILREYDELSPLALLKNTQYTHIVFHKDYTGDLSERLKIILNDELTLVAEDEEVEIYKIIPQDNK